MNVPLNTLALVEPGDGTWRMELTFLLNGFNQLPWLGSFIYRLVPLSEVLVFLIEGDPCPAAWTKRTQHREQGVVFLAINLWVCFDSVCIGCRAGIQYDSLPRTYGVCKPTFGTHGSSPAGSIVSTKI
jgi:hypothetical protein